MKFLSSERLSQHKYKTPEGYLICTDAILARTGKQTYRRNEVFADSEDFSEIEVDRPAEEVFSPVTLASFENKPITVEHPDEDVNAGNHNEFSVGFVRDVHRGVAEGQDVMLGTLVITDAQTINEIENGEHTDLSCGYDCDILDEAHPCQRNIRGNHVALCQCGRAGIARIVDSLSSKDSEEYMIIDKDEGKYIFNLDLSNARYLTTSDPKKADKFTLERANSIIRELKKYNFTNYTTSEYIGDSIKDSLSYSEEELLDYAIENLAHNGDENKFLNILRNYYSSYAELASHKPDEVKAYFRSHYKDSVKDISIENQKAKFLAIFKKYNYNRDEAIAEVNSSIAKGRDDLIAIFTDWVYDIYAGKNRINDSVKDSKFKVGEWVKYHSYGFNGWVKAYIKEKTKIGYKIRTQYGFEEDVPEEYLGKFTDSIDDAEIINYEGNKVIIVKNENEVLEDKEVVRDVEYQGKKYIEFKGKQTGKHYFIPWGTFNDSIKDDLVFGFSKEDLNTANEMLSKAETEEEKKLISDLIAKIKYELTNQEMRDSQANEELAQREYDKLKKQLEEVEKEIDRNDNNPRFDMKEASDKINSIQARMKRLKEQFKETLEDDLIESSSEEAFKKNIATEIEAGKDPKQAAAIAYSVQRRNDSLKKYEVSYTKDSIEHIQIIKAKSLKHAINKMKGGK